MFRALIASIVLAFAVSFAAWAQDEPKQQPRSRRSETSAPQKPGRQTVIVEGCVAQGTQPGTYILSARQNPLTSQMSERISGTVPNPTYQLYGDATQFRGLVGHSVRVKGTTEKQPEKTVQKGDKTTAESPKAEGTSGKQPKVTTQTNVRIELRRLDVQKIESVAGGCGQGR